MSVEEILRLLQQEYGMLRHFEQDRDPVSVLVSTILSQNTSDVNSRRAFSSLVRDFGDWERVVAAGADEVARSIRSGGLAEIKAGRIKLALQEISEKRGCLELDFLGDLPLSEAKSWLRQLPGVGPKTAGCVLLFSLGKPAMPVDTHVYRVAKRLGLIDSRASAERAHEILESIVPPEDIYQFHLHMVEHGRMICKAQRPRCSLCVLQELCPAFKENRFQGG
ncbi:endonuclease III domain-containing protein [Chloroflexota bacterium]